MLITTLSITYEELELSGYKEAMSLPKDQLFDIITAYLTIGVGEGLECLNYSAEYVEDKIYLKEIEWAPEDSPRFEFN